MGVQIPHHLEEFTIKVFGNLFGDLILMGYKKRNYKHLNFTLPRNLLNNVNCEVEITCSDTRSLSQGDRALVLAALLKLLLVKGCRNPALINQADLLFELGWPDTPDSHKEVEAAIEFYTALTYRVTRSVKCGEDVIKSSDFDRWLTTCRTAYVWRPQRAVAECAQSHISFCPTFVQALQKSKILFAEIDFGNIDRAALNVLRSESKTPPPKQTKASPSRKRNAVRLETWPVARRTDDPRPKIECSPEGRIAATIDTGAMASTILRALRRSSTTLADKRWAHFYLDEMTDDIFRQLNEELPKEIVRAVKRVRRLTYADALRRTQGLLHDKSIKRKSGQRGEETIWHSPEQLLTALLRAIEAIELDSWKPKKRRVRLNKRWRFENVKTATLSMIAAYWKEVDGLELNDFDSSQMKKWVDTLGLPAFSKMRAQLRQVITDSKNIEKDGLMNFLMRDFFRRTFTG